jgi:hypothetical protein
MTHILLAGAGFTRNWGGWPAKELERSLLARLAPHEQLRRLVQIGAMSAQSRLTALAVGPGTSAPAKLAR